ncbi:MAG: hypothetical protein KGY60_00990 [Bacteroidales bacterium]|nr:hypothetical protein [Bacteroidales bacterium]
MPYRRLPNTDKARMRALKTAHELGKEIPPFKLAFSQQTLQRLSSFLPKYEKALQEYNNTYKIQTSNQKEYQNRLKKARLYISHFIQVVNMSITRGEMPPKTRTYYGMQEDEKKLPALTTEQDLKKWGSRIIEGEEQRKKTGLPPVTNPTIAVVKVNYDNFIDAYQFQKQLQENHHRAAEKIHEMRKEADQIISSTWDEVESTFSDRTDQQRRSKAKEYGVVYFYRKNELGKLNFQYLQNNSGASLL